METIYFFNPFLIWISSQLREEREACCDDVVMNHSIHKDSYLEALLSLQEFSSSHKLALGLGGRKMFLFNRIKRLVMGENNKLHVSEKALLCLGLILVTAFTLAPVNKKNK